MNEMNELLPICLKQIEKGNRFIMGYFTVMDILIYEICYYLSSIFINIGDETLVPLAMKFRGIIEEEKHYKKNKEKLEGWPILFPEFPEEFHEVMKKLWCKFPEN